MEMGRPENQRSCTARRKTAKKKRLSAEKINQEGSEFVVSFKGTQQGTVRWDLIGDFNIENALMAIAAARHAGVPSGVAIEALA